MTEYLKDRVLVPSPAERSLDSRLLLIHDREKEIGRNKQQRALKPRLRYADDRIRMLVDLNDSTHHTAVVVKAAMPEGVGEHQIRGAVRSVLVGGVEESPKIRLKPQHIEVVPCRRIARGSGWIFARVESDEDHIESCKVLEAVIAIAEIKVVAI